MRDLANKNMTYRVNGTAAIKMQSAQVYDFPMDMCEVERGGRTSRTISELLARNSSVYRDIRSGDVRGVPISGATLSHKLAALFASIAFTVVVILITNLL